MKKDFSTSDVSNVQRAVIAWQSADREWAAVSAPMMIIVSPDRWEKAWRDKEQTLKAVQKELGELLVAAMDPYERDWGVARSVAENVMRGCGLFRTSNAEEAQVYDGLTVVLAHDDFIYLRRQAIEYWGTRKSFSGKRFSVS